ncbi:MAG TPA: FtsX-like permease family protein [Acidimicrobiales bacterium]
MSPSWLSTAWYRFSTSWRRLGAGYLALILIVGLGGGLALGSVAAARRTASSYSVFLASTKPSDLTIEPAGGKPITPAIDRQLVDAIRKFPHVRHVESYVALGASFTTGSHTFEDSASSVLLVGSVDGMLFDQDRFTVTEGQRADPADPRQVMVTQTAAQVLGLHVGQSLDVTVSPTTGSGQGHSYRVTVTGIGLLNRDVVQDQIARFPTYVIATPALTRSAFTQQAPLAYFGVQLDGTPGDVAAVERDWNSTQKFFTDFQVAAQTAQEADESIRPEALALGAFGFIAGLTVLLIAFEELARQRRSREEELRIMRSLGASPAMAVTDGLIGTVGAVTAGGLLAAAVAIALSPLAPIGPVRAVYPDRGFSVDWTVIGLGVLALVGLLLAAAVVGAVLGAPYRQATRLERVGRAGLADAVFRSGLPPSTAIGARFALDAGRANRGSSRWVLAGSVTALLVVSATLTFGHSLQNLVSQPSLYGWNWAYAVQSSDGYGPVPQPTVQSTVHHNRGVVESGAWFATFQLDGVEVPVLLASPGAAIAPPIVAGHGLEGRDQIVLGAATMAQLHKQLGDTVAMRYAPTYPPKAIRLTIVGVATMPAIGIAEGLHTSMGVGAVVPDDNGRFTEMFGSQSYPGCNGPNIVFLSAPGATGSATAQRAAQQLASSASTVLAKEPADSVCGGYQASVLSVQRPAQIVNYRSMGLTPLLLACALAAGATVALGLTLVASVRRRRRELAILKAIGFTPAQLQWSVLCQAGIVAVVGITIGVPLGVALGRWLWTLFAEDIGAVPAPAIPFLSIVVAALVALALAVGLSAVPGRIAARTPAVTALTAE